MRVLYIGSGEIAIPPLRWLANSHHEIVAVVMHPDRNSGRGRKTVPTPVKSQALDDGLDLIEAQDINTPSIAEHILGLQVDLAITMSFGTKIGPALLDGFPGGCLNIHPSLLPKYRGAAPVNWAIIRGETNTGVCVFRMVEQMDAGPILSVRETTIKPRETADELSARVAGIGCDALDGALEGFDPKSPPTGRPQDDSLATFAPKLTKQTGRIDLDKPADQIANLVNGLYSWPAVQLVYVPAKGGNRLNVRLARAVVAEDRPSSPSEPPGTVLENGSIACRGGAIDILEIQPAGKRAMTWRDFVNGRHVTPGDCFEPVSDTHHG